MFVFSGTGNTEKVAKLLGKEIMKTGNEICIIELSKQTQVQEIQEADALIVAYPVHAFNCPEPVLDFLRQLSTPKLDAYLLQTSGEPLRFNKAAFARPRAILRKKGCTVKGCFSFVMPYNIIFRHSDKMAMRMWKAAEIQTRRYLKMILSRTGEMYNVDILSRAISRILSIEHPGARLIGKGFRADNNCSGCGKCASRCPQENIEMKGNKPKFGSNCALCMRCVMHCPVNAIHASILNGWKVNGQYSFQGVAANDDEICRYCHNAYLDYFREAEKLVNENRP